MAYYQEVDYCSEEARTVPPAGFGRYGGGVQQHIVKEKFEEVDTVSRPAGGHHRHHHGHHGGHGFVVRETRVEEDINTRTGEFHERKESFVIKANDD